MEDFKITSSLSLLVRSIQIFNFFLAVSVFLGSFLFHLSCLTCWYIIVYRFPNHTDTVQIQFYICKVGSDACSLIPGLVV